MLKYLIKEICKKRNAKRRYSFCYICEKISFGAMLFIGLLGAPAISIFAAETSPPFVARAPDGLYFSTVRAGSINMMPVALVADGKFIDPYIVAQRKGIRYLQSNFLDRKRFATYEAGKPSLILTGLRIEEFGTSNFKDTNRGLSIIAGGQIGILANKSLRLTAGPLPDDVLVDKSIPNSEPDKGIEKIIIDKLRLQLIPDLLVAAKAKYPTVQGTRSLPTRVALYPNKKSGENATGYFGVYYFTLKDSGSSSERLVERQIALAFFIDEQGLAKTIFTSPDLSLSNKGYLANIPASIELVGIFDFDLDGTPELIAEYSYQDFVAEQDVRQFAIFHKTNDSWQKVFQTSKSVQFH